MKKIYLVLDAGAEPSLKQVVEELCLQKQFSFEAELNFTLWQESELDGEAIYLFSLSESNLKMLAKHEKVQAVQAGFLPHPEIGLGRELLAVANEAADALQDIMQCEQARSLKLLYCNDQPVFSSVLVGNRSSMIDSTKLEASFWSRFIQIWQLMIKMFAGQASLFNFTTEKGAQVQTIAFGLAVAHRPRSSAFIQRVVESVEYPEPMFHSVIFAPRSLSEILHYLFTRVWPKRPTVLKMTDYLGHIKTHALEIQVNRDIKLKVDDESFEASKIHFELKAMPFQVLNRRLEDSAELGELKESMRVSSLPKVSSSAYLVGKSLPWIHHADKEEVKELFISLKENAKSTQVFLTLMVLSTLLASVGLFANSTPVIIGAMILAPLMAPIVSVSMGALRQDNKILWASIKTLTLGILVALSCAMLLAVVMPLHTVNSEISARLSPTILDMGVAIISGIAAAYASAKSEVAKSLAGVAIAVALVPPLAVSGIGIGWGDFAVFWGAFLLFITNLFGIILAAALTFLLMGFSPFRLATKGVVMSSFFVALVSVPLVITFNEMVDDQNLIQALEQIEVVDNDMTLRVSDIRLTRARDKVIEMKVLSTRPITNQQIALLHQRVDDLCAEAFELRLQPVLVRESYSVRSRER